MHPMNHLELKYYLKDLERQALHQTAFVARRGPCVICAMARKAVRGVVGLFKEARPVDRHSFAANP